MMDWPGLYLIVKIVAVLFGVIAGAFVGKVLTPFVGNRRAGAALVVFCAALGGLALWLAVNRVGGNAEYLLVPIDTCFHLVGLIRLPWKGLSGGTEVWQHIQQFFAALRARAGYAPRATEVLHA